MNGNNIENNTEDNNLHKNQEDDYITSLQPLLTEPDVNKVDAILATNNNTNTFVELKSVDKESDARVRTAVTRPTSFHKPLQREYRP